ncbi:hypothetical protein BLA29_014465 [Euroglyphus maynei]|uniref:Uncharacterized protein n=1 Tax=Euroglyphus maynei TaxID=6958 RepID=A0A1Y3B2F4_EURMA|nr:hypothetical protein BLA29_014465 [Euroglyphus maynei]
MALSFDIYDGQKNVESRKNNDKKIIIINEDTAIERIPTFIEIISKVKYKDYIDFIESDEPLLKFWLVLIE